MSHLKQDRIGLLLARRIAEGLKEHPEWILLARENLSRWSQLSAETPSLLRCYAEWQMILERPVEEVIAVLLDPSDNGQRLRQNSPFAGALSPQEVWQIKRHVNETISA